MNIDPPTFAEGNGSFGHCGSQQPRPYSVSVSQRLEPDFLIKNLTNSL